MHFYKGILLLFSLYYLNNIQAQQIILTVPNEQYQKSNDEYAGESLNFTIYPYQSPVIDLRLFKREQGAFDGPDSLMIKVPPIASPDETFLLISLLDKESPDIDDLVIIIAENFYSSKVAMYVDKNSDKNYTNDGPPVFIKKNRDPKLVEIVPLDSRADNLKLWLKIDESELLKKYRRKINYKIENQFSIGLTLNSIIGNHSYSYDNLITQYPTWYNVHITGKSAKLSASYNFRFLRLGLNSEFQNLFFWTSKLNVRIGDPFDVFVSEQEGWIHIENVNVFRSRDLHSKNRLLLSFSLSPRIYLRKSIELQPTISGGVVKYLSGEYISERGKEEAVFKHPINPFIEGGLSIHFPIGFYRTFFASTMINKTWWRPEGFFESIPHENLEINFTTYYISLGIRFGL